MRLIDVDALTEKLGIGKDCNECQHNEDEFYCNWKPDVVDICEAICTAPTIKPEQHWIPCSERLPEVGTYVLISKKVLNFKSNLPNVCTAHRTHDPRSGKEEWNDMLFGKLNDDDVLAWMSLPEPYKGDDHAD